MLKKKAKYLAGKLRCLIYGINCVGGKIYIGKNVKITGGRRIQLSSQIQIRPYCCLFAGEFLEIGSNCDIGERNRIAGNVRIGENVLIGPDNFICSYDHTYTDVEKPIIKQPEHMPHRNGHQELFIGNGAWIGTHVAIIGDVHIGRNSVIGANSVVVKDVPDYSVVVGNPAKIVKQYNFENGKWEKR